MKHPSPSAVALLLLAAGIGGGTIVPPARAGGKLAVAIDQLAIGEITASRVQAELDPDRATAQVHVQRVLAGEQQLDDVFIDCQALLLTETHIACRGTLSFTSAPSGAVAAELTLRYELATERLEFDGDSRQLGLQIGLRGSYQDGQLQADFSVPDSALAELSAGLVEGYTIHGGTVSVEGSIRQSADEPLAADLQLRVDGLSFDNVQGNIAAADLQLVGEGTVTLADSGPAFDLTMRPAAGEVLLDSLYLSFAESAPQISARGQALEDRVRFDHLAVEDGDVLQLAGSGVLPLADEIAGHWDLELGQARLPEVYDRYLGNLISTMGWGQFESDGLLRGRVELDGSELRQLTLAFEQTSISDLQERFAVQGLNGMINYTAQGEPVSSMLRWDQARLYKVALGGSRARFSAAQDQFQLLDPLQLDVFDGSIAVETLAIRSLGEEDDLELDFEADIAPISLRPLTQALGLPVMAGNLSGQIPRVELRNQVLELGGALELAVFDGGIVVERLRVERLLGVLPTVSADIRLDNLDLQLMTSTFDFGEIQGRLEGFALGVRLLDWEPVAFNLELYTPPGDTSRHRISQRAVENITSIGGGPSALLSSTFLRFFEEFSYDELGISCQLAQSICRMGGLGPAPEGGYYIVRGRGIPRIDVIGHNRLVDFPELLARVEAVTRAGAPTVD